MIHRLLFLLFLYISFHSTHAQESFTISGHIRDAETGEELFGANYYIPALKAGGIANDYGFYSLTVPRRLLCDTVQLYRLRVPGVHD